MNKDHYKLTVTGNVDDVIEFCCKIGKCASEEESQKLKDNNMNLYNKLILISDIHKALKQYNEIE